MDHCLIDYGPQPRPVIAGQNLLPGQADFKQALHLLRIQLDRPVPEDLPRVVRCLQQAGHDHGLEVADRGGTGFQADVDLVRVRQHVAPKDLTKDGTPDLQEEGGRGLFLVGALSSRWDWYRTREPAGKVVWCELEARSAQQAYTPGFEIASEPYERACP